jgi:hypothetical protein
MEWLSGTDRDKTLPPMKLNSGKQQNDEKEGDEGKCFPSPLHPNSHTADYSRNRRSAGEEEEDSVEERTAENQPLQTSLMSALAPVASSNLNARPAVARSQSYAPNGIPAPSIASPQLRATETKNAPDAVLELIDGAAFRGISFGAQGKSVAGECVFQTGARIAASPTLRFSAVLKV